jgi:hypothetical protein
MFTLVLLRLMAREDLCSIQKRLPFSWWKVAAVPWLHVSVAQGGEESRRNEADNVG